MESGELCATGGATAPSLNQNAAYVEDLNDSSDVWESKRSLRACFMYYMSQSFKAYKAYRYYSYHESNRVLV